MSRRAPNNKHTARTVREIWLLKMMLLMLLLLRLLLLLLAGALCRKHK